MTTILLWIVNTKSLQCLGAYTHEDIALPGVKVEDVIVDTLVTYFENYTTDIQQAVYVNEDEYENRNWNIRARQERLNHKPFSYKINVMSDKPVETVVRVFIGPTNEFGRHIDHEENRMNFVEIDRFKHNLVAGKNVIDRSSQELYFSEDYFTSSDLWQRFGAGSADTQDFPVRPADVQYTFPQR